MLARKGPGPNETEIYARDNPLEIDAENMGMFVRGYSWELTVGTSGDATLAVFTPNAKEGKKQRSFAVGQEQLDKVRKALADNRYFGLPSEIGRHVPDGGERKLRVRLGSQEKTVEMLFHDPREKDDTDQRAERIWNAVRSLFNDDDAR
jgi:hypothetical protein